MKQRFSNRNGSQAMEWVQTLKNLRLLGLRRRPARTDMGMSKRDYVHAKTPKPPPEVPVRVCLKSQLMAALRQRVRPIVIEDHDVARPFARLLRARELRLRAVGGLVAETMCYALNRYYGANIDAHWYIGQYVLPGNIQKIILKPKTLGPLPIIALNADEGWSKDVSEAIAAKVREVADHEDQELTSGTLAFIEEHIGRISQPTLPLW
jgi:hypothetical protein